MPNITKNKPLVTIIFVSIICFILIGYTSRGRNNVTFVEGIIGSILNPVQKVAFRTGKVFENTFRSISEIGSLKDRNQFLESELEKITRENVVLNEVIAQYQDMADIEQLRKEFDYNYLRATITGKNPGNWFNRFTIDRGSRHGIKRYMPVVTGKGLVGYITEVGPNWSTVVAIIDSDSNASFIIRRTGDIGMARGTVELTIDGNVPFDSNVVVGDRIVTSGIGGIFPKGILIGEVEGIKSERQNLNKELTISPAVNFKRLEYVYVILDAHREQDIEPGNSSN